MVYSKTVSRAGQAGEEKNDSAQIEMHRNIHVSPTAAPVRKKTSIQHVHPSRRSKDAPDGPHLDKASESQRTRSNRQSTPLETGHPGTSREQFLVFLFAIFTII